MRKENKIIELTDSLSFDMAFVQKGTFTIGDRKEAHEVELDSFYIAELPVTQDLYEKITKQNPSDFKGKRKPVENINWYDAIEFCNILSKELERTPYYNIDKKNKDKNNKNEFEELKWTVIINPQANGFRLPTEAEWEYAARGGHKSKGDFEFSGSNNIEQVGWYNNNSNEETKEVGLKFPNELGIYDMSGNVWEWCWDWHDNLKQEKVEDPTGAESGSIRVMRGGGWIGNSGGCRVAYRSFNVPVDGSFICGFRLALSL